MDDELDLYDDLDDFQEAENKKSKELEAWEAKYNAAQLEITDLQAQNKALAKKIKTMEVNFQNLLDTAKAEIKRKDTQITQLRKEKDDICFRRKHAPNLGQAKPQPQQQPPPSDEPQRHQHKRGKGVDLTANKTEICHNNNNENCNVQLQQDKQHIKQAVSQETEHQHKTHHKRDNLPEATTTRQRSTEDRDHHRDRDRDRERQRERERGHERSRRRSRSRSRNRERCRSRERGKSDNHRQQTNTKELKRRRSRSRSRSSHRSSGKSGKHQNSRETEHKPDTKSTKHEKRQKHSTMETLFGSTPKHNSPTELISEHGENVIQQLMSNVEPLTPQELYTPQTSTESGEQSQSSSKQQITESIDNYFVSNIEKHEEKQEISNDELVHLKRKKKDSKSPKHRKSAEQLKAEAEVVNEMHVETNPQLDLIVSEVHRTKSQQQVLAEEQLAMELLDDVTSNATDEEIPHLNFIDDDDGLDDVDNMVHIPGLDLIENSNVINEDGAKATEHIPGVDFEEKAIHDGKPQDSIPGLDFIAGEEADAHEHIQGLDFIADENVAKTTANEPISEVDMGTVQDEFIPGLELTDFTAEEESASDEIKTTSDHNAEQDLRAPEDVDEEIHDCIPGLVYTAEEESSSDLVKTSEPVAEEDLKAEENVDSVTNENLPALDFTAQEEPTNVKSSSEVDLKSAEEVTKDVDTTSNEYIPGLDLGAEKETIGEVETKQQDEKSSMVFAAEEEPTADVDNTNINRQSEDLDSISEEEVANKTVDKELPEVASISKTTPESELAIEKEASIPDQLELETNETDQQDCAPAELIKDSSNNFATAVKKTKHRKAKETKCTKSNKTNAANQLIENSPVEDVAAAMPTLIEPKTPDRSDQMAQAEDDMVTPKRAVKSIQIIEDIRLPIMMDIEHIALKVDEPSEESINIGAQEEQDLPEAAEQPQLDSNEEAAIEIVESQLQLIAVNQDEVNSKIVAINTTITPKLTVVAATVMYAQPDSTKIDHSDDDAALVAVMKPLPLEQPPAIVLEQSYPNLSLETDTIELALEQLHQQSLNEEQPDETAVTSTSTKGPQTPKKDLIQILMQSPLQQVAESPAKAKTRIKKTGARTASERLTPNTEKASKRGEKTPIKKRKIDLNDGESAEAVAPVVLQTPSDGDAEQTQLDVTIDETLNASAQEQSHNLNCSDISQVTKRCSLGNSDYQFERINDEVVLRVTRRRRRPPAAAAPAAIQEN